MMMNKKRGYYDGPVIDSGMTLEELEILCEQLKEEDKKLTDWPPID